MAARRLCLATEALRDTSKGILAIALEYGFSSHSALTRAFQEAYGLPPGAVPEASETDSADAQKDCRDTFALYGKRRFDHGKSGSTELSARIDPRAQIPRRLQKVDDEKRGDLDWTRL